MKCTWTWSRQTYSLTARLTWTMHGCWQHSINTLPIGYTCYRCPAAASFSTTKPRIAVALRLGATMCLPHDCQCGQTIDALGLHCFSCLKNSGKHTRHSILNDIVWRTMTRAKMFSGSWNPTVITKKFYLHCMILKIKVKLLFA